MTKSRSGVLLRSHRHFLLVPSVCLAALTGILLVPGVASAQSADAPVTPTVTLVLSPATIDYGHQTVTASGAVTTSSGPVTDAPVTVSYEDTFGQAAQISLTTGSDGRYSGTIPDPEAAAQDVTASVAATSSTAPASTSAQLGFTMDAVSITANWAQLYVNAGSSDTLSGVASYGSGRTSHPLANTPLAITFTQSGAFTYSASATVQTAADGSFSYTTPKIGLAIQSGSVSVSSAATPFLYPGHVGLSFTVNQAAQLSFFKGNLSQHRVLHFSACGGLPEPLADSPLVGPLEYQYSAGRHGPWKTLGAGKLDNNADQCDAFDGAYAGTFTAPLANAYYRAYAPAVPGQMAAASRVIHLQRYPTRITGLTITPRRVSRDGKVTVSGRLWRQKGKWTPEARQKVTIEYRFKGKVYAVSRRVRTNAGGRFTGTFRVGRTASWFVAYNGGRSGFATLTKAIKVIVR